MSYNISLKKYLEMMRCVNGCARRYVSSQHPERDANVSSRHVDAAVARIDSKNMAISAAILSYVNILKVRARIASDLYILGPVKECSSALLLGFTSDASLPPPTILKELN